MNSISFIENLRPLIKIVHNNIATGTLEVNLTIGAPKTASRSLADICYVLLLVLLTRSCSLALLVCLSLNNWTSVRVGLLFFNK
nr:MAG TPA: hypothetical protein [Caudoviricetes sp.]